MTTRKKTSENEKPADQFAEAISSAFAKEQAGQAYGLVGQAIKKNLDAQCEETLKNFARGDRISARLSEAVDVVLKTLFAAIGEEGAVAICAVGGYGRAELAPFSDIDLLFLHESGSVDQATSILNAILYPLWDSGRKIGHSVHTPQSAVAFAREDMVGRTAFLDARFICGDAALFEDFEKRYDKLRKKTKPQFVKAKLDEQAARQTKAGETRYITEPDIKEGKGGLRDLQTIRWIYKYVYGGEVENSETIAKVMNEAERRDLRKAERFLWAVRAHMHDLKGRAEERLSFDMQPAVAARLGYSDRSDMTAAERLMKHYFLTSVDVGRLTRVLCAKLEEERAKRLPRLPKGLPRKLQKDEAAGKPNLKLRNGRLDFESAARARRQQRDLFRLFRAFSKEPKFDFHPKALALVSEALPRVTSDVRRDPVVAKLFMAILADSAAPERTLRIMAETGLLGKYIPAFGSIVGRIQYGLYRQFTIDEHVLRSVSYVDDIAKGVLKKDHPIASSILQDTDNIVVFYIAVLLHQSGWSLKENTPESVERLVIRVAGRLGLDADQAKLVGWACARHLLMVRTTERRNLTEVRAIANFAESVGDRDRLDLLLVLSVCYLRIVGQHSWDEFAKRQLTELYGASAAWMSGGEVALEKRAAKRFEAVRAETESRLAGWAKKDRERALSRITDTMLRCVEPDLIVRFATLMKAAEEDKTDAAVTVTPRDYDLEAIIYAKDRIGLLGDLAGACAAAGVSVRSVQALTLDDNMAIDVFVLQSPDGTPLDDPEKIASVHKKLLQAARKAPEKPLFLKRRFGDRREIFDVEPAVWIDDEASDECVVIEAEGLDRPGLLHELASAFTDLKLTISSAHIATYGERAVDAFYLNEADGAAVKGARRLKRIESRLLKVLASGGDA